jgi:hypothetical protein
LTVRVSIFGLTVHKYSLMLSWTRRFSRLREPTTAG